MQAVCTHNGLHLSHSQLVSLLSMPICLSLSTYHNTFQSDYSLFQGFCLAHVMVSAICRESVQRSPVEDEECHNNNKNSYPELALYDPMPPLQQVNARSDVEEGGQIGLRAVE